MLQKSDFSYIYCEYYSALRTVRSTRTEPFIRLFRVMYYTLDTSILDI